LTANSDPSVNLFLILTDDILTGLSFRMPRNTRVAARVTLSIARDRLISRTCAHACVPPFLPLLVIRSRPRGVFSLSLSLFFLPFSRAARATSNDIHAEACLVAVRDASQDSWLFWSFMLPSRKTHEARAAENNYNASDGSLRNLSLFTFASRLNARRRLWGVSHWRENLIDI